MRQVNAKTDCQVRRYGIELPSSGIWSSIVLRPYTILPRRFDDARRGKFPQRMRGKYAMEMLTVVTGVSTSVASLPGFNLTCGRSFQRLDS